MSPAWKTMRKRAIERDDEQCVECGMTLEEHKDELGCSLDVHHIEARVDRGWDADDLNELDNLITLCQFCHVEKYDRKGVRSYK